MYFSICRSGPMLPDGALSHMLGLSLVTIRYFIKCTSVKHLRGSLFRPQCFPSCRLKDTKGERVHTVAQTSGPRSGSVARAVDVHIRTSWLLSVALRSVTASRPIQNVHPILSAIRSPAAGYHIITPPVTKLSGPRQPRCNSSF